MKRFGHFLLSMFGFVFWFSGTLLVGASAYVALLTDSIFPNSPDGNCWAFAFPKYIRKGGYLIMRPAAEDVTFLWVFKVPHVMWAQELPPNMRVLMFVPRDRKKARWFPYFTAWYKGRILRREYGADGREQPGTQPADLKE